MSTNTTDSDTTDVPMRDGFGTILRARLVRDATGYAYGVELWDHDGTDPDDDFGAMFVPLMALGEIGSWLRERTAPEETTP
jgi:hypothetical protein